MSLKRLFPIAVPAIIAAIIGGYSWAWFEGAKIMRSEIETFVAAERAAGRVVTHEPIDIVGYPMAVRAKLGTFSWINGEQWAWSGESLQIAAVATDLDQLILVPQGVQSLTWEGEVFEVSGKAIRIGLTEDSFGATLTEVAVTSASRPGERLWFTDADARWQITDSGWAAGASASEAAYSNAEGKRLGVPGVQLLANGPGDGSLTIDEAQLAVTDPAYQPGADIQRGEVTRIDVSGAMALNGAAQPDGRLDVSVRWPAPLIANLREFGVLSAEEATQITNLAKSFAGDRAGVVDMPLVLRDGKVLAAGLFEIGEVPPLY